MANIAIFRINYKSDFILTLNSDAGWMTPFCIKFWTGAPSQAYFAGYDGTTYTHCAPVEGEPTKLLVQFDDHHLPIGDLKFQIGYHFTVADFPTSVEDEVLNQDSVIIDVDDAPAQVMLDFNGETAPEIQFSLPAYANEAQRIANEQQRIANEQTRISNEETRIAHEQTRINQEQTRQQNEAQRIQQEQARVNEYATLKADAVAATGAANDAAALANAKAQLAADKAALADAAATLANQKAALAASAAQLAADKAALAASAAQLANDKAALAQQKAEYAQTQGAYAKDQGDYAKDQGDYAKDQGDYAKAQGDTALADHQRAERDHETAAADHTTAGDDHTTAAADHTRAESDHSTAADDHTLAGTDHTTAAADHTQAGNDHTRAESDHTRAESDHAAVAVYVDSLGAFDISAYHATGGVLATYADLSAALGSNGANIPELIRKGGMSVRFVTSYDNNYVQFRYMSSSTVVADFTNVDNWQGVDEEPVNGSKNFVESGGIANFIFNDIKTFKRSGATSQLWDAYLFVPLIAGNTYKINISKIVTSGKIYCYLKDSSFVKGRDSGVVLLNMTLNANETQKTFEYTAAADDMAVITFYETIPSISVSVEKEEELITIDNIDPSSFDQQPTENSSKLLTSGTLYTEFQKKVGLGNVDTDVFDSVIKSYEDVFSVSDKFVQFAGHIDSSNRMMSYGASTHIVIPVKEGDTVKATSRSNVAAHYCIVSEYQYGKTLPYNLPLVNGINTDIAADTTVNITIPATAKYILFRATNNQGNSILPVSLKVDSVELIISINDKIGNLQTQIDNFPLPTLLYERTNGLLTRVPIKANNIYQMAAWAQGAAVVGGKITGFDSSNDAHTNYAKYNIIDIETMTIEAQVDHNLGHVNGADYCNMTDCFITSDSVDYDSENNNHTLELLLIPSFKQKVTNRTTLEYSSATKISIPEVNGDFDGLCCFGERENIVYTVSKGGLYYENNQRWIYKFELGMGSNNLNDGTAGTYGTFISGKADNEYNGTAKLVYVIPFESYMEVQGGKYFNGKLIFPNDVGSWAQSYITEVSIDEVNLNAAVSKNLYIPTSTGQKTESEDCVLLGNRVLHQVVIHDGSTHTPLLFEYFL